MSGTRDSMIRGLMDIGVTRSDAEAQVDDALSRAKPAPQKKTYVVTINGNDVKVVGSTTATGTAIVETPLVLALTLLADVVNKEQD